MRLPKESKIESSFENDINTYHIPLLIQSRSITLHLIGIILVVALYVPKITNSSNNMNTQIIMLLILGIIILADLILICWMILGKEVISIDKRHLIIKNTMYGVGTKRKFELDNISDIRINIEYRDKQRYKINIFNFSKLIGLNRGFVIFKYKGNEIKFGSSLSMEEANFFVEKIKKTSAMSLIIE